MRQKRFLIYLGLQLILIPVVLFLFQTNPDRKMAATQAGVLFVGVPLLMVLREVLKMKSKEKIWFLGHLQFLMLFAIPILGLRLLNWNADFSSLSVLGVSGPSLHRWSNLSFMLMMASNLWTWYRSKK